MGRRARREAIAVGDRAPTLANPRSHGIANANATSANATSANATSANATSDDWHTDHVNASAVNAGANYDRAPHAHPEPFGDHAGVMFG